MYFFFYKCVKYIFQFITIINIQWKLINNTLCCVVVLILILIFSFAFNVLFILNYFNLKNSDIPITFIFFLFAPVVNDVALTVYQ